MFPVRSCVKPENLGNRLEYLDGKMLLQWNSHILSKGALVDARMLVSIVMIFGIHPLRQ